MGKADLHIHTTASDGSCEPGEIAALAGSKMLNTISITDHDTLDGYLKAIQIKDLSVRIIPGVEITACHESKEIHILAYNFIPSDNPLNRLLQRQKKARLQRMEKILENLRQNQGIDLSLDDIKAQARSNNVGRPHVARILVKKKIVSSIAEAFIRYLGTSLMENISVEYADIKEVVGIIRRAGGVTSLAHPGPLYSMDEIRTYTDLGIDGIECIHPAHNFNMQKKLTDLAEKKHLLVTGGSDFHGTGQRYDPYFGIVTLSEKKVHDLERITRNRKKLKMGIE